MAYLVYNPTTRRIASARQTLALANTAAGLNADLSAYAVDKSLPPGFAPGEWFLTAANKIARELPLAGLEQRKAAARAAHVQYGLWANALVAASLTHSSAHVNYGHDILWGAHMATQIVMTDAARTNAAKLVFCQKMALGASDVTTVQQFFERVHEIAGTPITGPVCWVNPNDGEQKLFTSIPSSTVAYFGGVMNPGPAVLRGGAWIEDLT